METARTSEHILEYVGNNIKNIEKIIEKIIQLHKNGDIELKKASAKK